MVWLLILGIVLGLLFLFRVIKTPLISKLISSFDNTSDGFSARKLSAFVGVVVSVIATFKFIDNETIIEALGVWLIFSLLCLGIITAEQLIRFYKLKKGEGDQQPEEIKKKSEENKEEQDPKI